MTEVTYKKMMKDFYWEDPRCPLCGSQNINLLIEKEYDSIGHLDKVRILHCRDCKTSISDGKYIIA